jgi:hypothetical protein
MNSLEHTMKALIWKEWRENLKWIPLPGLVILLVFLIDKPDEPMFDLTDSYFFCLTAVGFGAALGFVQIFFEAQGDKRSLLVHRPLSPTRIFLAKAVAGVSLYVLALGIPFACLEGWLATPGSMPAPYYWRTGLPWLADILSGLVYYFAGMLVAQRSVRWYGSRGLALAGAIFCSCLVWTLPEFWQVVIAVGISGSLVGVAAWGSFAAGGAYAPQPRFAKAALATTFLAGLFVLSVFGKQMIGQWCDSGFDWNYAVDRQGRVLVHPMAVSHGPIGPWTELNGQQLPELAGKVDYSIQAPGGGMELPVPWSYRNSGQFYIECTNGSKPGNERWYYDQARRRLVGYDRFYHQPVGSFGPDGFSPTGRSADERFPGELRYRSNRWHAGKLEYLAFSDGVYAVDYARRTICRLFTPPAGETVTFGRACGDHLDQEWKRILVSTDKSLHFLKEDGVPVLSVPRVYDRQNYEYLVFLGKLENPERFFAWYRSMVFGSLVEPKEFKATPFHLHEYDTAGREVAHRTDPQIPYPTASYAKAFFGLVTPMTEVTILYGASRYLRSEARSQGSTRQPVLLSYLDNAAYYIPGRSRFEETPNGLVPGYLALIVLAAAASALGGLVLARRYAFSRGKSIAWALVGFFFGWVGLILMLVLQEWAARVACPKCRRFRVVTRDSCEYCGALQAAPARDGTEVFESAAAALQLALTAS